MAMADGMTTTEIKLSELAQELAVMERRNFNCHNLPPSAVMGILRRACNLGLRLAEEIATKFVTYKDSSLTYDCWASKAGIQIAANILSEREKVEGKHGVD